MKSIVEIRKLLPLGQYELSRHAFRRVIERNISEHEIRKVGENALVVEEYPNDKYSSSASLLGYTQNGRPLHIQVSRGDTERGKEVI